MMDILFLGTGASVPSRDRGLPCVAVRSGPEVVLFDCGEGTQRQLMVSPFSLMKVSAVLVTHLHGDHFYGLPGLMQTMGLMGRKEPLTVCGPEGFSDALDMVNRVCGGEFDYKVDSRDLSPGDRVPIGNLEAEAFATVHGVPSLGYRLSEPPSRGKIDAQKAKGYGITGPEFSELEKGGTVRGIRLEDITGPPHPGLSVVYTGDTRPCRSIVEASKGADAIIHESTYSSAEAAMAEERFHSTAAEAARDALEAGCRYLFLVHLSGRFGKDTGPVENDARAVFGDNLRIPSDMCQYRLSRTGLTEIRRRSW